MKRAASLRQRKYRQRERAFLVEGADLVAAGLAGGHRPQVVFVRAERADELVDALGLDAFRQAAGVAPAVYPVSARVAARISTLETPAEVAAVFPLPERLPLRSLMDAGVDAATASGDAEAGRLSTPMRRPDAAGPQTQPEPLVLYADGVQDPGNLGTLLRAAVAFGAAAVAIGPGSADPYGPKTVRAGMGALFGLRLAADVLLAELVEALGAPTVYGLAAHRGTPLRGARLRRPGVLVIGSERRGISDASRPYISEFITIPLAGPRPEFVESLNAGVAGAIALYEFAQGSDSLSGEPSDHTGLLDEHPL